MKSLFIPQIIAGCLWISLIQGAYADTIALKNGEKIEGQVLREEGENYVVEVQVTETIKDERTIPKKDVKFINKIEPSEAAFKIIADLVPTPDLLSVKNYEARILSVEEFINEYPKSNSVPKAKEMYDVLTGELEIVRNGGIKFGKQMISAEDYQSDAYKFDASIAAQEINEAISRREFLNALHLFTAYDAKFADAAERDELAARISEVLVAYGASIDENLASIDFRIKKRKEGLEGMSTDNRMKTQRALEEEMATINARYEKQKSESGTWVTPDVYHKASLEEARRQVENEKRRLDPKTKKPAQGAPLAEAYRDAWSQLVSGTEKEKVKLIDDLKKRRMPDVYLLKLSARAGLPEK